MNYTYPPLEIQEKQGEINKILQKYENKKSILFSSIYLFNDILLNLLCFYIFYYYFNTKYYYCLYSIIQGTLLTGLWVIAHECGHGAYSKYQKINNIIGYILHEILLVPYFAWQYTHSKHHKYTNHLIYGETHVPSKEPSIFGDSFVIFSLIFGWPLYLFNNVTGGKVQSDMNTPINRELSLSHFNPWSQIFPPKLFYYICLDTIGILSVLFILFKYKLFYYYIGPYFIVNFWLVLYTLLHHTDKLVPHYGIDEFNFLRGALSTIDRNYPSLINFIHHDIGSTHVLHHVNHRIAHYNARAASNEIYPIIKDYYFIDNRSIYEVVCDISKNCHYVKDIEGIQFYKK